MNFQSGCINVVEFLFLSIGSYFDMKNREIPINYLVIFGGLGIAANVIWKYQPIFEVLAGGCIGVVFLTVGWMTKEALGYGDGWALVILGIMKGWYELIPVVFGAFLLSSVYGIGRLIGLKASRDETIPFYPFLLIAFVGVGML